MKLLLVLSAVIICVNFSEQKVKYVGCPEDSNTDSNINNGCFEIRCSRNRFGSLRFKVDCPEEECLAGATFAEIPANNSMIFPDCCSKSICEKKINDTYSILL